MENGKISVGILGCTGSIGRQTLDVIRALGDRFCVKLLACASNAEVLKAQIAEFRPEVAVCGSKIGSIDGTRVYNDTAALSDASLYSHCDIVVNGIGGIAGLPPTLAVLASPAKLATANKESLVSAGRLVMSAAKKFGKTIIPVDSEHSALWQCLEGSGNVRKLVLTASGGAFRDYSRDKLVSAKAADALKHPTWVMGRKVTIDSATLFNKCMEIIEARNLFGIRDVEVVVHRESIVHALVGYNDGSYKASLSCPDMRLPIQYAITEGKRLSTGIRELNLAAVGSLTFEAPDISRFPCLGLAESITNDYKGAVACAADELLVDLYLADKIGFYDIPNLISEALARFDGSIISSCEQVFGIDKEVKEYTLKCLDKTGGGK